MVEERNRSHQSSSDFHTHAHTEKDRKLKRKCRRHERSDDIQMAIITTFHVFLKLSQAIKDFLKIQTSVDENYSWEGKGLFGL